MRVWTWLSAVVAVVAAAAPRAAALEPNRTLTQYVHRIWQVQQGLPQASVFCIEQTRDGYLWLGTQAGLVRFDGIRFTVVNPLIGSSKNSPWVTDLQEDSAGTLWAATDGDGIVAYHNGSIQRYGAQEGLPSESVRCLFIDRAATLWAGTSRGPARFANGRWNVIPSASAANDAIDVTAICQTRDGVFWFGGGSATVYSWDGSALVGHQLTSVTEPVAVSAMLYDAEGSLWVGASRGLVRLKDGREQLFTVADGLADDWILSLASGQHGALWIGTKDGYSRFLDGQFESFHTRDGLSQSTVYSLFEDREGSLWVGTKFGLNQFGDRRTIPFTVSEGLPSNDTGPVVQDTAGNVWVGTLGAGLSRFDGRRFSLAAASPALSSNSILALMADGSGIWVGTERGLDQLRDGHVERSLKTSDGLPSDVIRCLLRAGDGTLWIGTSGGLTCLRDGRLSAPGELADMRRADILALAEHAGALMIATEGGGLWAYSRGQLQEVSQGNLPPQNIDSLFEDPDGRLWIGTRGGGLRLLDRDHVYSFSMKDGLYDDDIYGIVGDDQGRLWMACSKGVFFVNRDELRKFAAGAVKIVTNTPFSPTDALRTIECQPGVQPVAWRMRDGHLWFSTIHGVIVIDPAQTERRLPPAPTVIEEAIVNGKAEPPDQLGKIGPGVTNIEFRYTALSFRAPTRITFRYKLDGFDRNWIDAAGRREAIYTNLPPGNYRFRLTAANIYGSWGDESQVAFAVAPHLYQRAWFFPLCVLVLALLVWQAYRARVHRIRAELQTILAERSRIARELHDTLIQGFSGVTMEMQALSTRLTHASEKAELGSIIQDAGAALSEARRSVAGLRTQSGSASSLAAAVEQAAKHVTEAKDIRLKLQVENAPDSLSPETQYNLVRIAQEAVSNAVKHSGGRNVEVSIARIDHSLQLTVKDDGRGFDQANGSAAGHYGLIGMRERAAQIGADLRIDSSPGRGTSVRAVLPIRNGDAVG